MNYSDKDLRDASIIALRDCMGLQKSETLLIVTDELKREIGLALHNAGGSLQGIDAD